MNKFSVAKRLNQNGIQAWWHTINEDNNVYIIFNNRYYKIRIGHPTRFQIDSLIMQLKLGIDPQKARYPKCRD